MKTNQLALPLALIIVVTWILMTYRKEKMEEKKKKTVDTMFKFMQKRT